MNVSKIHLANTESLKKTFTEDTGSIPKTPDKPLLGTLYRVRPQDGPQEIERN